MMILSYFLKNNEKAENVKLTVFGVPGGHLTPSSDSIVTLASSGSEN